MISGESVLGRCKGPEVEAWRLSWPEPKGVSRGGEGRAVLVDGRGSHCAGQGRSSRGREKKVSVNKPFLETYYV